MRRFIYLDTDTINSYLAQIYDGLVKSAESEIQSTDTTQKQSQHTINGSSNVDLKVFGKGIEGKMKYTYNHLKGTSNSELIKDVQTKLLHDNAFDQLMSYINTENPSQSSNNIGSFIELFDTFYIMDLNYYQKLFSDKKLMDFMKKSEKEKVALQLKILQEQELTISGDNKNQINKKYTELLKQKNKEVDDNFNNIKEIIDILISLIPYRRTLCIGNNMVVLNDEYMRDSVSMTSFKYGGKIKIFGYITNTIGQNTDDSSLPAFAQIGAGLNEIMLSFFTNKRQLNIVHPIAIYYE